jgi:pyruvate/2-oxoglutarate dehydrogenase complex dihydrolipoamide acyltransferase (E2) component
VSRDIVVPDLGEATTEITLSTWLKQPGESIKAGEVVAEIMTEKVNTEVTSPADGVLEAILAKEGDVVTVGQPIARLRS